MRKQIFGRRLKRDTNERKALFRSLMHGMVLHGKIKTTEAKAKSIKGDLEHLVTIARANEAHARNLLMSRLVNAQVVEKLISEVAPKFNSRPGGYTRILRMSPRVKDGAKMVLLTWVEEIAPTSFKVEKRNVSRSTSSGQAKVSKGKEKIAKKSSSKK